MLQTSQCWVSTTVTELTDFLFLINSRSYSPSQQCCYDNSGQLITGIGGGSTYRVYPNNWKSLLGMYLIPFIVLLILCIGHLRYDVGPFFLCCSGLFKACNKYYDRRPNDDCADWPRRPPPGI